MQIIKDIEYRAAIYLRLSKDDGDLSCSNGKNESNSIASQRLLINDFVKQHPEIRVYDEYCDDGFTGTNFDRPRFQDMISDVKKGIINCIIVKDLSRFGREYIESGMYIEKIFPSLGVRFIAINDNYDNATDNSAANDFILPFKNLINDSYCRDISVKVRSNLDVKRRNGEFVGSRVVYGYRRSSESKNKLAVDETAAAVVKDIFRMKTEGMSAERIADSLNASGVLSPIEYKKANGSKEKYAFQKHKKALWSAVAVYRILSNEIYTGTLLQGKTTTPNYKVKKTVKKSENEWSRTENAHEAIITKSQFELVQRILLDDTRSPKGKDKVHIFSGKVFCADCKSTMVRKVSKSGNKEYAYLICNGHKKGTADCFPHNIKEEVLYEAVFAFVKSQLDILLETERALKAIENLAWEKREVEKLKRKIATQNEAIQKVKRLKASLYEDLREEIITEDEYHTFKKEYDEKIITIQETIMSLEGDLNSVSEGLTDKQGWLSKFTKYRGIDSLNRTIVVNLIDKIYVGANNEIEVIMRHKDQFAAASEFIEHQKKEAV